MAFHFRNIVSRFSSNTLLLEDRSRLLDKRRDIYDPLFEKSIFRLIGVDIQISVELYLKTYIHIKTTQSIHRVSQSARPWVRRFGIVRLTVIGGSRGMLG